MQNEYEIVDEVIEKPHLPYELLIEKIKDEIKNNNYPPSYNNSVNNKSFTGNYGKKPQSNCLSYALDISDAIWCKTPLDKDICLLTQIGRFKHNYNYIKCSRKKLIRLLYETFSFYGFTFRNSSYEDKLKKGETKILVGFSIYDFHFIRQDRELSWSHIAGIGCAPSKVCEYNENPINYMQNNTQYSPFDFFAYRKIK